ncbi:DUF6332 family protein [Streptantibioticus cattleyicolor]|uniref:Uncharacterized protein n=1 Tax=Streptantibioticus cattleyicolor (strain ATCC 35852 / DSM 46488 / JCM 4925 / NBRC 14057 / NRRL 8057) TaxID=1003195 RepID=F8JL63_STREN
MEKGSGPRDQRERDAVTVEIGYALASAAFLGVVVFVVFVGPAMVWHLPRWAEGVLVVAGAVTAGVLAVVRVVHVLRRHARAVGRPGGG